MGTNFYLMTNDKAACEKYFGYDYELVDSPEWGYSIHIAKTSCGWLPLFQSHDCIKSIKDLKNLYDTGKFVIYDEYATIYSWPEFEERVLKFNGGVKGAVEPTPCKQPPNCPYTDPDMPDHTPVSHFEYADGKYALDYFTDGEGYEFTNHEFS